MDPYYQRFFETKEADLSGSKHRQWSVEDRAELKRLVAAGTRPAVIAKTLNRSLSSLYSRAEKEGISIPLRRERWSKDELKLLADLVSAGASNAAIKAALPHRTHGAVAWHIWNIGGRTKKFA